MATNAGKFKVRVERNVEAKMRDGVVLRADVARPDAEGKFPALVQRTPYGKAANTHLAEAGYVVVSQDMRGRYASDGVFTPKFMPGYRDAADGFDTVEWAARLPYANGKVGAYGISYPSWASWELASLRPPHLVAMFNGGYATRLTDWELGGVLRTGRVQQWLFRTLGPDLRRREGLPPPHTPAEAGESAGKDREKPLWFLPLKDMPDEYAGGCREIWRYWLDHHHEDIFDFQKRHGEVDVPVLHITGWHDRLVLTVDHFAGMRANGRTPAARKAQRLVVGPWSHGSQGPRRVGEVDFGKSAAVDFNAMIIRWFDYWLKGESNGMMRTAPVRYFVMGENRWRTASAWPVPGAKSASFHLVSGGCANTASGDGRLVRRRPRKTGSDRYDYDPRDPVMSLFYESCQDAPYDQRRLDGRRDVLVYTTGRLRSGVRLVGRPEVVLHAASSARDTDFIVKLMDVHPDGFVHQVSYGIVRARFRIGFDDPQPLTPGQICRYRIPMLPTAVLFRPGHRIRLDVTSSDFPNFDRNHNTGGDDYGEVAFETARQEIFHGPVHPSRVVLPLVG
ncbi:MAG: CocE/NonD family hydrolase [Gemmatimonadetes bacterium]|nr:CocE/NonD family hydrolase [Gemmatimonadota bacterium]